MKDFILIEPIHRTPVYKEVREEVNVRFGWTVEKQIDIKKVLDGHEWKKSNPVAISLDAIISVEEAGGKAILTVLDGDEYIVDKTLEGFLAAIGSHLVKVARI